MRDVPEPEVSLPLRRRGPRQDLGSHCDTRPGDWGCGGHRIDTSAAPEKDRESPENAATPALRTRSTRPSRLLLGIAVGVLLGTTLTVSTAGAARLGMPLGKLVCAPKFGVVFCQGGLTGGQDRRVPSFDGVPLDADLTLPATGTAPYPLIVLLHGLAGNKTLTESTSDDGAMDNVTLAVGRLGGAVLQRPGVRQLVRERGVEGRDARLHQGMGAARRPALRGPRHPVPRRDARRRGLREAGDRGGVSYGGGQSLELAMLKNRMELLSGKLVPFVSPGRHVAMRIAAVYAVWPWDDLDTALAPNGRLSTSGVTAAAADRSPAGVPKGVWDAVLYAETNRAGYLSPAGVDPQSDLTTWEKATVAGEPFAAGETEALADLERDKSAIGIPMAKGGPAPTVIQSGFTDTLFPVNEALHYANAAKGAGSKAPLLLVFDDVGHPWAQGKKADVAFNNATGIASLNSIVLHHRTPRTGVLVRAQTCPASAPSGPTVSAPFLGGDADEHDTDRRRRRATGHVERG